MDSIRNERELGQLIKEGRRSRNMTQMELAHAAQVSRSFVINVERGNAPRAEVGRVFRVLRALSIQLKPTASQTQSFDDALQQLLDG
ncbi:MAG: helix-turn-helix domain-containing protein [Coriobacteriales bacterium]|jgi:transcriptional regulator with XRE-family HTH domain|nr:helix-turn-helix domain-containing protein [Coriobacteriales bacterium]